MIARMKIRINCLYLLLCILNPVSGICEGLDYWAGAGARLLPQGGGLVAGAGYGVNLWGDSTSGSYNYGYLRPSVRGYTSLLVTQAQVELSVFPLALAGFTFGYLQSWRNTDFKTLDCAQISCRSRLGTSYLRIDVALGYEKYFLLLGGKMTWLNPVVMDRPFADENTMLIGNQGGDSSLTSEATLGYKIDDRYSVGFYFSGDQMRDHGGSSNHESLFVRREIDSWSLLLGAGTYESVLQSRGITGYAVIRFVGLPSIAFF